MKIDDVGNLMYLYMKEITPGESIDTPDFLIKSTAKALNELGGRNWIPVIVKETGEDEYQVIGNSFIYAVAEAAGLERIWCIIADDSEDTAKISKILAGEILPKINLTYATRDEIKAALEYLIEKPGSNLKGVKLAVATNRIDEAPRKYWKNLDQITTLKCGITKAKLKDLKQVFYVTPEPLPEIIKDPAILKTLTVTELKNMAKKRGIAGFSKKSKDALVELLSSDFDPKAEEILKLYASGQKDFSPSDDEVHWDGINLSGANLSEADLTGVFITNANLRKINLSKCDLMDTDFTNSDLSYANLESVNLDSADLRGANLTGANLKNANLECSNLLSADFRGADLRGVKLEDANYDSSTQWPDDFDPDFSIGVWLDDETFVRCNQIRSIEIARSWDSFADALVDMGYEDDISDILDNGEEEYYSFSDLPIDFDELVGMNWDYLELRSSVINKKFSFRRDIMNQLEDAIDDGKVRLSIFLYT